MLTSPLPSRSSPAPPPSVRRACSSSASSCSPREPPAPPDGGRRAPRRHGGLPYRPTKQLASGPADAPLASLFLADARRICAAVALPATPALWTWPFSWPLSTPPPPVSSPSSPAPQSTPRRKFVGAGLLALDLPDLRTTPRIRAAGVADFVFLAHFAAVACYPSFRQIRPSPPVAPPCLPASTSRTASPPPLAAFSLVLGNVDLALYSVRNKH